MTDNALAQVLHQQFLDCPPYVKILARTKQVSQQELHITGLSDSAKSLILALLQHEIRRPCFIISADLHKAASYHQEISNLSRSKSFLFPSSEVSPYEQVLHSPDTIAAQVEVLQHMMAETKEPYFVNLPARALMQRVLDKKTLHTHCIKISKGEVLDIDAFKHKLVKLGYAKESIVTLRGEFATRGDIIDVFPSSGMPVRIEVFGDEVESIRHFNIDNQRSTEEITSTEIYPRFFVVMEDPVAIFNKLDTAGKDAIANLSEAAGETLRLVLNQDLQTIQSGLYPESIEYYSPYIHNEVTTILHYLPDNALIVFDEWDMVSMACQSYEKKLADSYGEGVQSGRLLPLPRPLHLSFSEVSTICKNKQRLFVVSMPHMEGSVYETDNSNVVKFDCHMIDRFAGKLKEVTEKIKEWLHKKYKIVISTEQPQRVLDLLQEWDCPAAYLASVNDDANLSQNTSSRLQDAQEHQSWLRSSYSGVWIAKHGFVGGFRLEDVKLISITDAELFGQKRKPVTYRRSIVEKNQEYFTNVSDLKVNDYVVHIKHGIGQFIGVQRIAYDNQTREYLAIQYLGDDRLYVPVDQINLLSRYRGSGDSVPRLSRLGGADWETTKKRVKRSIRQVAEELVNLYALRAKQQGFQALSDTPWQYEMEEAFPYEETPDQWQAICDVKGDMESAKPMDRLICGDVGFGKTEVAIRAIFKTIMSSRQAVVMVPTTVLAQQHFNTLCDRFAPYPIRIGLLSRFRTASEQRDVIQRLALGECDVVIGTHRILQKDIFFKDLGLVVIDEEHRFGVAHKEKLKQLRVMVDILTMSATPIPRTLNMAISGVRDMSLINTPPVNRLPVKTYVGEYRPQLIRTAILHELERGGQVFFVHNRVESIERVVVELQELIPEARIMIGHGQMQERELENVMLAFSNHEYDILVCTTIIESGLDIPNANTIIIDEADKLGLAQLYQIRGRVGRSDLQAYCYCLYRPDKVLTDQAQNRLKAIREFTTLGSGYQIAVRDMEIRGVGNILGPEQHGHMIAVGFDLYCKLLGESVAELQGKQVNYDADTQIDINVTAYVPDEYIEDSEHRIVEYKRLADVKSERELEILTEEWRDRFGPIPDPVKNLSQIVRLRLKAAKLGISAAKTDLVGLRMLVNYRLQQWLPIQNKLPTHLSKRTTYKPGSPGTVGPSPYILIKCEELEPKEKLDLLEELLDAMVTSKKES